MVDLSTRWPAGLGSNRWWVAVGLALAFMIVAVTFDRQLAVLARSVSPEVEGFFAELTRYGESDWILVPAAGLLVITAAIALFVRWKLMRTMLWQFSSLYAFILLGVGVPSLIATLAKRAIGRGRPVHFDEFGLLHFQPNWLDWTFQSLPSGHATTIFALAMVIAFISPRWAYLAFSFALAVGISRVIVGAHYPSDVVAGAILGVLGAYLVRLFFAGRGWGFRVAPDGSIRNREMSSLRRYLMLKRRGSAPALQQGRP